MHAVKGRQYAGGLPPLARPVIVSHLPTLSNPKKRTKESSSSGLRTLCIRISSRFLPRSVGASILQIEDANEGRELLSTTPKS